jgi:hypothetical protein
MRNPAKFKAYGGIPLGAGDVTEPLGAKPRTALLLEAWEKKPRDIARDDYNQRPMNAT